MPESGNHHSWLTRATYLRSGFDLDHARTHDRPLGRILDTHSSATTRCRVTPLGDDDCGFLEES